MKTSLRILLLGCLLQPLALFAQIYCVPTFGGVCCDGIENFAMDAINNQGSGSLTGYSNYSYAGPDLTTTLLPGETYQAFTTAGSDAITGDYHTIWLDADQSGAFELDEKLAVAVTVNNFQDMVLLVTVPTDALPGYTRLRVMSVFGTDPTDACGQYTQGEAEDYTVLIQGVAPCMPLYAFGNSIGMHIDGVVLGAISNTSSGGTGPYTSYSGPNFITSIAPGSSQPMTITAGPYDPSGPDAINYSVWVDLDQSGSFQPDERLTGGSTDSPGQTLQLNVDIPADAIRGYTRLRVMCAFIQDPSNACGVYDAGETEDYTLVIDDGAPCIPMYGYGSIDGDYITDFVLENVVNQATGGDTYTDYGDQGLVIRLAPGTEYFPIITSGTYDPAPGHYEYLSVWIDLDQNGTFEPDEKLTVATTEAPFESVTPSLFIPTDAPTGYTRMRVMCVHNEDPTDACGIYNYGETEDYTLVIDDGSPCIPVYTYGTIDGDYIDGFQLNTINNVGSGSPNGWPYSDYRLSGPGFITSAAPGGTYTATITSGADGIGDHYTIWADLNNDLTFAPNEVLGQGTTGGGGVQTTLVDVTIPADAPIGYTTLRVICAHSVAPTDACGNYPYGETEDYTLVIDDGAPCIPLYGAQASAGDFVAAVELNNLSWTVPTAPPTWGYESAMIHGAHLEAGVFSELTVTKGTSPGASYIYAWIDWYENGFDASDLIGGTLVNGPGADATFGFTPGDAAGYKRMRIACVNGPLPNDEPCDPAAGGHAVDFAVAVGDVGLPCYPLQGYGAVDGDGIESMVLQGFTYNGVQEFPYHLLNSLNVLRFDAGASDALQITSGSWGFTDHTLALDMNDDGDFSDANEVLGTIQSTVPNEVLMLNFTIPATCPPGQHFLRLRASYPNEPLGDLCEDSNYGSINDVVVVVEDPNGPCVPFSTGWTLGGDFIDGVQLGGAQNLGTGGVSGPAYSAYLSPAIAVIAGMPDTLRITSGNYPGDYYSAWIDHNADNDFDDANELLGWIGIADPYTVGELPFTIPNGTLIGNKRMRVRCTAAVISDACATSGWGETEDYTVNVDVNTGLAAIGTPEFLVLPTTNGVQLLSDAAYIGYTYTLFDATGRIMATGRITADRTDLPMIEFARGAYTVHVTNGEARQVKRFVW